MPGATPDSALRLIAALMPELNRCDPLDEAAFAAMETVVHLLRARQERNGPEGVESVREALGSARATVIAAGYALSASVDAIRSSAR